MEGGSSDWNALAGREDVGAVTAPSYVIRPEPSGAWTALRELWDARALLGIFVWRDVRVRYQHTFLGAAWNILQPLGMMAVYAFVFGIIFTHRLGEVAYPLFLFPAILLWQLLGKSVTSGGTSLESFAGVMNKVYFPRMIAPAAVVAGTVVDLLVSSVALLALMVAYGSWPDWHIIFAPVFVLLTLVLGLGLAIWLTALDARYKDIRHTLTFITQFWLFATPVMYPISLIPERYQLAYSLNPAAGLIQGFRWSLIPGTSMPTIWMLVSSVGFAVLLLVSGVRYFAAREGNFVDTV